MVDFADVWERRVAWIRAGEPACDHAVVEAETHRGVSTRSTACLGCGESWRTPAS